MLSDLDDIDVEQSGGILEERDVISTSENFDLFSDLEDISTEQTNPLEESDIIVPMSLGLDSYLSHVDFDSRMTMENQNTFNSMSDENDDDDDEDSIIMLNSSIRFDEIPEYNVVYDNQIRNMSDENSASDEDNDRAQEMLNTLQERGYIGLNEQAQIMQYSSRELYRLGYRTKSLSNWMCSEHYKIKADHYMNVDTQGCQNYDEMMSKSIMSDIDDYKAMVDNYAADIGRAYDLAYDVVVSSTKKESIMRQIQSIKIPTGYDESLPQITLNFLTDTISALKAQTKEDYERVALTAKELVAAAYPSAAVLDLYQEDISRYVKTILDIYLDSGKISKADEHKLMVHKETNIRQIIGKIKETLLTIEDKFNTGNLQFIKQIVLCSNNKYCILDEDNNLIEIAEPLLQCTMVKVKNSFIINSLPMPVKIGNKFYILNENDTALITQKLLEDSSTEGSILSRYKDFQSANCSKLIYSVSKFSANKIHSIFKQINEERKGKIPNYPLFVTYDEDIIEFDSNEAETVNPVTVNLLADDIEYSKAIKEFQQYLSSIPVSEAQLSRSVSNKELTGQDMKNKLIELAGEKTANKIKVQHNDNFQSEVSLGYRKIATFITSCLSLDYVRLKNQALFSLIYQITDNPFLNLYLNKGGFMNSVSNAKGFVERLSDLTPATVSNTTVANFNMICKIANKPQMLINIEGDTFLSDEAKNTVYAEITQKLSALKQVLTDLEQENEKNYSEMIGILEKSEKAFIFTKIIHCSSVKVIDFDSILCNPKLAQILDRIADRMICTNYADKFYEQFIHLSFFNPNDYVNALDKYEMLNKLEILFGATSAKRSVSFGPLMRPEKSSITDFKECFSYMSDISILPAHEYSALGHYIKDFNVYKIVKTIKDIDEAINYFGEEFQKLLVQSIESLRSRLDMSIIERYNNSLEFSLGIAGFQVEELSNGCLDEHKLKFTRFILKREDGEEIDNYIARYNRLVVDNRLDSNNSVDMLDYLAPLFKELSVVSFVSYLTNIEYSDYLKSAMVISVVEFCHECARFDCAHQLLGIDPTVSLILANKKYKPKLARENFSDYNAITSAFCETPLNCLLDEANEKYTNAIVESKLNLEEYRSIFDIKLLLGEILTLLSAVEDGEKQLYTTTKSIGADGKEIILREPIEDLDSEVPYILNELKAICPDQYAHVFDATEKH